MSLTNPILKRKSLVEIALNTGSDPVPSASLSNALEITEDSSLQYDQVSMNSQADVVNKTMSKRSPITGTRGGTATINGNLKSTDGTNEPAIANGLKLTGMVESTTQEVVFSDVTGLEEGDSVSGDTSGASGTVAIIDGTNVIIKGVTSGPFVAEDVNTGTYTISSVSSTNSYTYVPDSDSNQVGSVFFYTDGNRLAIKSAAANFTVTQENGGLPKFSLNILGKNDDDNRESAALPDATFASVKPPVFIDSQMLLSWSSTEYTPINLSAEFNYGATPVLRANSVDSTGLVGGFVSSRSDAGGSISIEVDDLSAFNPDELRESNQVVRLSYRLGDGTAGRTIYIRENIQFSDITRSVVDGIQTYDITFERVGITLDDDEGYIVFK